MLRHHSARTNRPAPARLPQQAASQPAKVVSVAGRDQAHSIEVWLHMQSDCLEWHELVGHTDAEERGCPVGQHLGVAVDHPQLLLQRGRPDALKRSSTVMVQGSATVREPCMVPELCDGRLTAFCLDCWLGGVVGLSKSAAALDASSSVWTGDTEGDRYSGLGVLTGVTELAASTVSACTRLSGARNRRIGLRQHHPHSADHATDSPPRRPPE